MAGTEETGCSSLPPAEKDDEASLVLWQEAWLRRHRQELIRRVPTMDVVDRLIVRGAIDPGMDVYQRIRACHEELRNERAALLLDFVASQPQKVFWDFQAALGLEMCADLALQRNDVQAAIESFTAVELAASACAGRKTGLPPPVEVVITRLKTRYRKRKITSLSGHALRNTLDKLRVSICLLSLEQLDALCGCSGQRQPFGMRRLKDRALSVVNLEDLFNEDENGEVPDMQLASGIAGSGKTTAFTKKAPYEWSNDEREPAFWEMITLFFQGNLTDPEWWKAQTLAEVFGIRSFKLTKNEEDEVVRYICSHAENVLLVADSLDEAKVNADSLLWRVLTGNCPSSGGLEGDHLFTAL